LWVATRICLLAANNRLGNHGHVAKVVTNAGAP
jgi:hypothetical protein